MRDAGERFGAGGRGRARAGGVRQRQPDRADHRRVRAPRRLRRLAGPHPRAAPATRSSASTTSTTRAPRCASSASRFARGLAAEQPEEYGGDYVAGLADRIEDAADADPEELAKRGIELMLEEIESTLRRFRVNMDRFFSERSLYESGAVEGELAQARGRLRVATARCGCGPPPPATTRTACCAARPASSPTSRPTSPTTPTSSGAAYDHLINVLGRRPSRLRQAPACRLGRRWAAIRARTRS